MFSLAIGNKNDRYSRFPPPLWYRIRFIAICLFVLCFTWYSCVTPAVTHCPATVSATGPTEALRANILGEWLGTAIKVIGFSPSHHLHSKGLWKTFLLLEKSSSKEKSSLSLEKMSSSLLFMCVCTYRCAALCVSSHKLARCFQVKRMPDVW